ncbi:MAG: ABC-F family ATP-binding cassette domain-containing protein [Clostridia bacterium]|nr:ABC-F family ATP-binding cassette domain-containing protein [Clostridia bacterium]
MLEILDVSLRMTKDERSLVENFSFTLSRGDKAVIIGEEGNGKSTFLKCVYDPELVSDYCEFRGKVIKKGSIGYLSQLADEKLLSLPVCEIFADADIFSDYNRLIELGLDSDIFFSPRPLSSFSGGEKVKLRLARILCDSPEILLLDEPTNDLDIGTLEWMEDFIRSCPEPVLFVSHDEMLIENAANVIIHFEQLTRKTKCRATVSRNSYSEYISRRRSNFDHQEMVAKKQREDHKKQLERWRQIYDRVDHEQRTVTRQNPGEARLLKKKMHTVLSMKKRFEREVENYIDFPEEEEAILTKFSPDISLPRGKTVLELELPFLTVGERTLAENLELFVYGGEHIGITGVNGCGKTTLLRLIAAQLTKRTDITAAYMPQDYSEALDYSLSPIEYLAKKYTKDDITRARTFMGSMKFTHEEMTQSIAGLSGGQRAKILFLDMVLKNANVLILDEPTRNFSPLSGPVVRKALSDFGGTIISVSHDRKYLHTVCDRVLSLDESGLWPL